MKKYIMMISAFENSVTELEPNARVLTREQVDKIFPKYHLTGAYNLHGFLDELFGESDDVG